MIQEPKEIIEVWVGNQPIQAMYNKSNLIFGDSSQICFTNGYWVDEFPWEDNSYWMD